MKKLLTVLLGVLMIMSLAGCSNNQEVPEAPTAKNSYADFVAAELDSEVEVLMSVQGHQAWWLDGEQGKVTVYGQCDEGGYFCYELLADEATANAMTEGTLIRVKGVKSEWAGEVEIMEGTAEILAGAYDGKVYEPTDVTSLIGKDELIDKINQKVTMTGLEVVSLSKKDSEWDPDLYITVKSGDAQFDLCVENYLTDPNTDVYKVAETLKAGDIIDITGFLYWYNGANPHVTAITIK